MSGGDKPDKKRGSGVHRGALFYWILGICKVLLNREPVLLLSINPNQQMNKQLISMSLKHLMLSKQTEKRLYNYPENATPCRKNSNFSGVLSQWADSCVRLK
jgi:hypothetical protein